MNQKIELPLVTIITVVFNSVNTLEQTIESVINQSYQNIEYIIIDGGSNDGSVDIIKKYSQHLKYWVSEKDDGIYYAMNKALVQAKGFLIGFLNSDDWYEPNAVENAVRNYRSNSEAEIFHGLLRYITKNNQPDLVIGHYSSFLNRMMIEHPTCFIKKTLYDKVGMFNVTYQSAADYEWMLRARNADAKFLFIPELITNFRRGGITDTPISLLEEILIKKRFGLISHFEYLYRKLFIKVRDNVGL